MIEVCYKVFRIEVFLSDFVSFGQHFYCTRTLSLSLSHRIMAGSARAPAQVRSLYRVLMRELPPRLPTSPPSFLRQSLRASFLPSSSSIQPPLQGHSSHSSQSSQPSHSSQSSQLSQTQASQQPQHPPQPLTIPPHRHQLSTQLAEYLAAQRTYVGLIKRYNPGMDMDEEERVRLTARRVGMDLPKEFVR